MFLPETMRSSAPAMPSEAMARAAVSRSGENSSVMAATGEQGMEVKVSGKLKHALPAAL